MKPISVTVSNRGYIVLPAHIRKQMNIVPGTKILINKENDKLILETVPSFTKKLSGLTRKTIADSQAGVQKFIDEQRKDHIP
ncbi:MAG: AbrB/MazE/SpoVT family DNA-binding domain-containing protein [Desulfobacterales bacterium]